MTTSRRRPAAASRILAGGVSAAAALALIAGWSATADAGTVVEPAGGGGTLRVVITDSTIDPDVAAALDAHARGLDRTQVAVAQPPSTSNRSAQTNASHSTTQAS
jgi:predicted transcriptional regulator